MPKPSWPKFSPQVSLKTYLSDRIEVGYTQFGPILGIAGTMTTQNKIVFVYHIKIDIEHLGDETHHPFDWFSFRPHEFRVGSFTGIGSKMASKFMVAPDRPFQYNIVFSDQRRYAEIKNNLKTIKMEWDYVLADAAKSSKETTYQELFQRFLQMPDIVEATAFLREMSYWREGNYSAKILITTQENKPPMEIDKSFALTNQDAQSLEENALPIIADLCRQPDILYNTSSPALK